MISTLFFFLLFETIEPSYGTLTVFSPMEVVAPEYVPFEEYHPAIKKTDSLGPVLEAQSVYAFDLTSETPLFTDDIFTRRPIASIAKLMTAMVILDSHALNEVVTVSQTAAQQEGSRMWLAPGEKITIANALKGLLIPSGNDAAVALAEFHAGSEEAFVEKMNEKASSLGLRETHFSNAKGFDDSLNYSTAFDTALFARAALGYPFIREVIQIKKTSVTSTDGALTHPLESTNELLEDPDFPLYGIKTGSTPLAGESLVGLMKGPNNHEILTVILNSPARFKETKILLDWIKRNFEFQ